MYMIYTGRRLTMCIVLADFQHGLRALLLYKYTTPQAGVVRLLLPIILTPVTRFGPGGGRQGDARELWPQKKIRLPSPYEVSCSHHCWRADSKVLCAHDVTTDGY